MFEYLADGSDDWTTIADALDTKWTTVERVLNSGPMKADLGVNIDQRSGQINFGNGNEVAGRRLLRAILAAMANTSFRFEEVEKKEDREAFLARFAGMSVKAAPATPGASTKPKSGLASSAPSLPNPSSPPGTGSRPRPEPVRKTLAPKQGARTFHVKGPRLNPLYTECRHLSVDGNENAAALLLRVFVELSTEALLIEKAVAIPTKFKSKGAANWGDIGIPLAAKIQCAIDLLDPTNKDKTYQPMRVAIDSQSHSVASINTLHGYFHNLQLTPQASDVMKAWDIWEPYLRELHGAR